MKRILFALLLCLLAVPARADVATVVSPPTPVDPACVAAATAAASAAAATVTRACPATYAVTATYTAPVVGTVSLAVAGAPNLPFNGTSTAVAVGLLTGSPSKVELSRDGFAPFATWTPAAPGPFFKASADGKTLNGSWCISASCWGNQPGDHALKALATYADGKTASSTVALKVSDPAPPPPPPTTGGTTTAQWAEIAAQRLLFNDPNDCKARVDAVPTTGFTLAAGGDIASALASNQTVLLQSGTYKPTGARLDILTGKKLVAAPGASPVLDLSALTNFAAVYVGDNVTLSGVDITGAQGMSIITFDIGRSHYSNGGLLHRLTVHDSGRVGNKDDGTGVAISGGSSGQGQNWCAVDVETYNLWNPGGAAPVGQGGNSDGISSKFGAGQTTFINVNSHNNGDDGIDMWQGGASYHYFGQYHDNGKVPGVTNAGDGNGVKLGTGSVSHKFYKSTANNNKEGGFNLNGNTTQPTLVQSTASGNPGGNYMNGVNPP